MPAACGVLIGGEGTWEELAMFHGVARHGMPAATGMLGVIGPIRMAYGQSISTVRFIAGLLSDLVVICAGDKIAAFIRHSALGTGSPWRDVKI
jgi:heat-inducible transcriptional repressor